MGGAGTKFPGRGRENEELEGGVGGDVQLKVCGRGLPSCIWGEEKGQKPKGPRGSQRSPGQGPTGLVWGSDLQVLPSL